MGLCGYRDLQGDRSTPQIITFGEEYMPDFVHRFFNGYRARMIKERYYATFCDRPKEYVVHYNDITGPYKLVMRLADGPGMRERLRDGTEMPQRRIFLPLLKPGWICCDVGAHVGDYTVEMALLIGFQGRVFAYEAVPHYFDFLQKSVRANRLTNVVTRLAVVGARPGKAAIPREMLTGSVVRPGRLAKTRSAPADKVAMAEIPVICLDQELDRLDAIKVDCEGYELEVLKGMERVVRENPKLILFLEVHERQLGDVGSSLPELAALLLREYRFTIHQISRKHCICSQSSLPLDHFPRLNTIGEFVTNFHGT